MKDWNKIAAALAPDIPEADAEKIRPTLEALEAAFRPLLKDLTLELETSYTQMLQPQEEQ